MEDRERIKGVRANEETLYRKIISLVQDLAWYDLAELKLSVILSDPHGSLEYLSSPIVGTPDELRVFGYAFLGQCLHKNYCAPNAPNPSPERNHDVLVAYRCAAVGSLRFFSTQKERVVDILELYERAIEDENSPVETIAEYILLVQLQRQALELFQELKVDIKGEERAEEDKKLNVRRQIFTAVIRGMMVLSGAYLMNNQVEEAIFLLGELVDRTKHYFMQDCEFPDRVKLQLAVLDSLTQFFSDPPPYPEEMMKAVASLMVHCMKMTEEEEVSVTKPMIDQYVAGMANTCKAMKNAGIEEHDGLKVSEIESALARRGWRSQEGSSEKDTVETPVAS